MKSFGLGLVLGVLSLTNAMADGPITLDRARTGQVINVWYAPARYTSNGNTSSSVVSGVHITVSNVNPATTRVVFINNCTPSSPYVAEPSQTVYNCAYGADGVWLNSDNCIITGRIPFRSDEIRTWWTNHGGPSTCSQQIAVSVGYEIYLNKDVPYEDHNFDLQLPIARK